MNNLFSFRTVLSVLIIAIALVFNGCDKCDLTLIDCVDSNPNTEDILDEDNCNCINEISDPDTPKTWNFDVTTYTAEAVQEALILMDDGDTIRFAAGTFSFANTLSLDDKDGVVVIGAGIDDTTLDFTNQTAGAEGIKVTATNSIIANLTVKNPIGDGIKAKDCHHFSFINVGAIWEGVASENNGAYGLYPTTSTHILIEGCYAKGASDAGLYVGQCTNVIMRNSTADNNVAGIEFENTINADCYGNTAINNTGGILVFDLPDLPMPVGGYCRVFNNVIENNNYENFAPEGNIVGSVPPGTGIMLLASNNTEVFNNIITNNNVMGIGIVNYEVLSTFNGTSWDDPNYIPYPRAISIHDNTITRTNDCPTTPNGIGSYLMTLYPACDFPDMLWDGLGPADTLTGDDSICVSNSGSLSDLDLGSFPLPVVGLADEALFNCTKPPLEPIVIDAPTL